MRCGTHVPCVHISLRLSRNTEEGDKQKGGEIEREREREREREVEDNGRQSLKHGLPKRWSEKERIEMESKRERES